MKKTTLCVIAALLCLHVYATNPLIPMTAITGKPSESDVRQLLTAYKSVGIEQFLIYPRSGLELEYMGDEWMDFVECCLQTAESLGMKVWLYDEYNWPSGSCKGQVMAEGHEDLYPHLLMFDRGDDGKYGTRVVLNRTGADLLNPEAAARFIELTHEKYYARFAKYFGSVIPAIFTDEPSFNYSTTSPKGFQEMNFTSFDKEHFPLCWYPGLEEDYLKACGHDLHEDVVTYLEGTDCPRLWENYYTLVGDRMRSSYIEPLSRWCEDHGIHLTGHLMYEKLYKSVRCNGDILKALSLFGMPGFDEATTDIDIEAREMEVSGLALAQYAGRGKDGEICELYAEGPADLTLSHLRQLMWMCACFGIDNYIVALAAMDARGNAEKNDWYFSSGPTQPWFDYYPEFGREAEKAASFAGKEYVPQVRVRVPSRYFMSLDKTPEFERRGLMYLRFLENLLKYQIQFLLLDEDEDAGGLPVLAFGPDGFHVEGEKARYDDSGPLMAHCNELAPRKVVVLDADGAETRDVLVRVWGDGSITLVDLTDKDGSDRLLTVVTDEGEGTVRLPGHGAYAGTPSVRQSLGGKIVTAEFVGKPVVTRHGTNFVRCIYTRENPTFSFRVGRRTRNVRLVLRDAVGPVSVRLDGRPVKAARPDGDLPEGFRQLYRDSRRLTLRKGVHTISIEGGSTDWRYLPGVFIAGDFEYDGTQIGSGLQDGLRDYAGCYDISGLVDVPAEGAATLWLDTNLACTEVLMDGRPLGRRAWAPYEWAIPEECKGGRHELTVRITTSIMPLFGEISKLDDDQPYVDWMRIKPGQHGDKARTGVFGMGFRNL